MDQVQLTTRYQAESLSHFALAEGDLMVTDAGYPVPSSVEVTQQSKSFQMPRTTALSRYCLRISKFTGAPEVSISEVSTVKNSMTENSKAEVSIGKRGSIALSIASSPSSE